jgi:PadR family transcriptional regulator, regulatory protein PadR
MSHNRTGEDNVDAHLKRTIMGREFVCALTPTSKIGTTYCVIATPRRTAMSPWVTQLRKGLVELCILAVLKKGEAYGYQIVDGLRAHPGLDLTESTVYPVLSRLAREGLLQVRTEASPSGPPRRYYRLTPASEKHFQQMTSQWNAICHSLNNLMQGAGR